MDLEYQRKLIEAAESCIRLLQEYVEQLKAAKQPRLTFRQILNAGISAIDTDFKGF